MRGPRKLSSFGWLALVGALVLRPASAAAQDDAPATDEPREGAFVSSIADQAPDYEPGPGTARDEECLICHVGLGEEEAPKLNLDTYHASAHADQGCIGCHPDVEDPDIEHEEPDQDLAPVNCESCHEASSKVWVSVHGDEGAAPQGAPPAPGSASPPVATATVTRAAVAGDPSAQGDDPQHPACKSCHGMHDIFPSVDPRAHTHPVRQTETCGECHEDTLHAVGHRLQIPEEYLEVVQRGNPTTITKLMNEGELIAAACSNCHGGHGVFPSQEAESTLHPANINATCGRCHSQAARAFETSAHAEAAREEGFSWKLDEDGLVLGENEEAQPPVCSTCHDLHGGPSRRTPEFHQNLVSECGTCHADLMKTYQESYHGKATMAGDVSVAQCSDCHGYHDVRAPSDPESTLAAGKNRVKTCQQCHAGAPPMFASFMPHADPMDPQGYPLLFVVMVLMTALIATVFVFFGLHTVLWAIRDTVDAIREGRLRPTYRGTAIERFSWSDRVLHAAVMLTFLGLAATGAPLRFADTGWAQATFEWTGGPDVASWLHRAFGLLAIVALMGHLIMLLIRMWPRIVGGHFLKSMTGPDSMVPRPADLLDLFANFRYFLGLGPKPDFDRWTYWEKFDYWAVFWSIPILGLSGIVLWIPETVTYVLPGWLINFALIVHSDQALLAMGFIFGIHFFNSHLRRSKFPLDEAIFTGTVPLEAYQAERRRAWERLEREGRVHELQGAVPSKSSRAFAWIVGTASWLFGLLLLGLIIHGFITSRWP